jgi:hypothetical protein
MICKYTDSFFEFQVLLHEKTIYRMCYATSVLNMVKCGGGNQKSEVVVLHALY